MENTDYLNSVNLKADSGFPFLILDAYAKQSYPKPPGFHILHHHEDFQFILVYEGTIRVRTLDRELTLPAQSCLFINSHVVHQVKPVTSECHYKSFLFPPCMVEFYEGSPAGNHIRRISENKDLSVLPFNGYTSWEKEIRNILRMLGQVDSSEKNPFYPYEILTNLCLLFLVILKNIVFPQPRKPNVLIRRMEIFLSYIEAHYKEPISLEELARSANVSKSECLRCFKQTLSITPYNYLLEYRLLQAASLLENTQLPISDISSSVGFNQLSHFGKNFRIKTGYTPRDYRKWKQGSSSTPPETEA